MPGYEPPKPVVSGLKCSICRLFQLVQVKIENGDFHHVGIIVIAGECLLFKKSPLRGLEKRAVNYPPFQIGRLCMIAQNVRKRRNKKPGGTASRITDALPGLRIDKRNDQIDDVTRRAELAVRARS